MSLVVVTENFVDPILGLFQRGELIDTDKVALPQDVKTVPYGPETKELQAAVAIIKEAQSGRLIPETVIIAGEYIPIASNLINVSALTFDIAIFQRVGSTVNLQVCVTLTGSDVDIGSFEMTIPVGAPFLTETKATGLVVSSNVGVVGRVLSVPLASRVRVIGLVPAGAQQQNWHITFGYEVAKI